MHFLVYFVREALGSFSFFLSDISLYFGLEDDDCMLVWFSLTEDVIGDARCHVNLEVYLGIGSSSFLCGLRQPGWSPTRLICDIVFLYVQHGSYLIAKMTSQDDVAEM